MKRLLSPSQNRWVDRDECVVKSTGEEKERVSNNHVFRVILQFIVVQNVLQLIHVLVVLQIARCRIHHRLCVVIVIVMQRGEARIVRAVVDGFIRIHEQDSRIIPFTRI